MCMFLMGFYAKDEKYLYGYISWIVFTQYVNSLCNIKYPFTNIYKNIFNIHTGYGMHSCRFNKNL